MKGATTTLSAGFDCTKSPSSHCQGSEESSGWLRGQDQLILANLDNDALTYREIGLLEPMALEKDERNLGTGLVTDPVLRS
jgi:hypothetical protein